MIKQILIIAGIVILSAGTTAVTITSILGSGPITVTQPDGKSYQRVINLDYTKLDFTKLKKLMLLDQLNNTTDLNKPISNAENLKLKQQSDSLRAMYNLYKSLEALLASQNKEIQLLKTGTVVTGSFDTATIYKRLSVIDNDLTVLKNKQIDWAPVAVPLNSIISKIFNQKSDTIDLGNGKKLITESLIYP